MDIKRKEFINLVNDVSWSSHYIGVGNPDSNVLIIGKECAIQTNPQGENYDEFLHKVTFENNYSQWNQYITSDVEIGNWREDEPQLYSNKRKYSIDERREIEKIMQQKIPQYYNPRFPFYKQHFTVLGKSAKSSEIVKGFGGVSATWYNYQKLIDLYRANPKRDKYSYIDFLDYCFITEMSDECRLNNHGVKTNSIDAQNTVKSINQRAALIRNTPFFQQFKNVILLCGDYFERVENFSGEYSEFFGNANVIHDAPELNYKRLPQLSFAFKKGLLEYISQKMV